jgi:hypothetical protein
MKLKTLALTVVILALLSAGLYWSNRPAAPATVDPRVGQALVGPAAVESAAQLRLTDQGKSVLLTRQPDGSWLVPGYYNLPADFSKLSSFMTDLSSAKVQRLVTVNPDRIARLEFKDSKIELLDASGKVTWSVLLGKNADAGGRFIRFGSEPAAYLATLNAFLDVEPKNWADPVLLNLKPEDIAKVKIPVDPFGSVIVSRATKDAPWSANPAPLPGQRVSADKISTLLASLTALHFTDSSDPADPAAAIAAQYRRNFVLTMFDGKSITVAMGRKPEEKTLKKPAAQAPADKTEAAVKPSPDAAKAAAPEYDTIPAGPVYVDISSSDAAAPINARMKQRAYQMDDYVFTGLPQKSDDLFEPAPPPAAGTPPPSLAKP